MSSPTPGEIIRREREARGWSAYRLAKESGVAPSVLSRVEGGRTVTLETARKVFAALGVSLAVFDARE